MSDVYTAADQTLAEPYGCVHTFARVLSAAIVIISAAWSLGVPRYLGIAFYPAQLFSLLLGATVAVAFLTRPWTRRREPRTPVAWYDLLAALVALIVGLIMAIRYPALVDLVLLRPPEAVALGAIMLLLALEALRRVAGPALVIIT